MIKPIERVMDDVVERFTARSHAAVHEQAAARLGEETAAARAVTVRVRPFRLGRPDRGHT
ncbi:hypothetical protein ACFPC0_22805 [Streptomyces andamanensis]|uniref:Uncharacterized protein n=1 Tax=Streptomyces andamanensis TaxID=1565035 RepID=A0ABV8TIZ7_9ACTN